MKFEKSDTLQQRREKVEQMTREEFAAALNRNAADIGEELKDWINGYHRHDWPTVTAVMKLTTEAMLANLSMGEKQLADHLVDGATAVLCISEREEGTQ